MGFINSMVDFFNTLTFIDFVFFFAVIVLLILIIVLIYFIKINEEVLNREPEKTKNELELINDAIKNDVENKEVNFTHFEKEQEDKAIISYDELVKKSKNYDLNYSEEKEVDGVSIKKINLEDMYLESDYKNDSNTVQIRVVSYKKEEEFLQTLKNLHTLLN